MNDDKPIKLNTHTYPVIKFGKFLLKKVNKVLKEYSLLNDTDNLCIGVSGGKDSLTLLNLMLEHKRFYNGHYRIAAVHVVSDYAEEGMKTKEYLENLFKTLGVEYHFLNISVIYDKSGNIKEPSCFWCSWNRRQVLFRFAADNGFNKLALAHHSDDVAETTLLNLIYHGSLETIIPKRAFFNGSFDLIRPFFYVREKDLVRYANMAGFETTTCSCPKAFSGRRKSMKSRLMEIEKENRQAIPNLWRAAKLWHEAFGERPLHSKPKKREQTDFENDDLAI